MCLKTFLRKVIIKEGPAVPGVCVTRPPVGGRGHWPAEADHTGPELSKPLEQNLLFHQRPSWEYF